MNNPYKVIEDFETEVAKYTGAPYCVAVNSCTNAIFLSLMWYKKNDKNNENYHNLYIPNKTYVSVPMQIIHAGMTPHFYKIDWKGCYQIENTDIWDSARRFTSNMYKLGQFMCTSHHWTKILGIQHGGCILHDNPEADVWFRKARYDGRIEGMSPKNQVFDVVGYHMMMPPENAAAGLVRLANLPRHNDDLPNSDYPDLSTFGIFK